MTLLDLTRSQRRRRIWNIIIISLIVNGVLFFAMENAHTFRLALTECYLSIVASLITFAAIACETFL